MTKSNMSESRTQEMYYPTGVKFTALWRRCLLHQLDQCAYLPWSATVFRVFSSWFFHIGPVASKILRKVSHLGIHLRRCTAVAIRTKLASTVTLRNIHARTNAFKPQPSLQATHMLLLWLFSFPTLFLLARNVVKNPVGILSGLGSPYMPTMLAQLHHTNGPAISRVLRAPLHF